MNVRLLRICIALGVIGLVAMLPFDAWYTRLIGVACLLGFVVTGVFLIASPWYLDQEQDEPAD